MGELEFLQAVLSRTWADKSKGDVCLDDVTYSPSNEKYDIAEKCEAAGLIKRRVNSIGQPMSQAWYSGTDGGMSSGMARGSDQFYEVYMPKVKARIDELRKGA